LSDNNFQRIFHGEITPQDLARALIVEFNQGNMKAQQLGKGSQILVQIASKERPLSGGSTSISVSFRKIEDGVAVKVGKQSWFGVAASLGQTALYTWRNPWRIIDRLDDVAQDLEYLQLTDQIWEIIESTAQSQGATFELSDRLRRLTCEFCQTANPVGAPSCIACGAPLGKNQPTTCPECGFVLRNNEIICPNCRNKIKK
jgi:hypothetical protein